MARIPLTLAIRDCDAPQRVIADPTIDGGEASFSRYLQRVAASDDTFVGLPAFVMRGFRHRCVFVRRGVLSPICPIQSAAGSV